MKTPILYSFRRCPYAIRARFALKYAQIKVEIREVDLKNKPKELLQSSPKGTVPVLVLRDNTILEESVDIMRWALTVNDPAGVLNLSAEEEAQSLKLITENDTTFKKALDIFKYSVKWPESKVQAAEKVLVNFCQSLETRLEKQTFLVANHMSLADIALFPFIRQLKKAHEEKFLSLPIPKVKKWLDDFMNHELFKFVMKKYPLFSLEKIQLF